MKVVDGVYTGFVIMDEKDILELRHMIKNYKPISKNDIAFLLQKLEKKGKKHLIPFFEENIIEKDIHQNPQVSTTLPKKKKTKAKAIETYQKKTYKASDFQFLNKEIKVGEYVCKTERAFVIPHTILQKIQGEFTIMIRPDKTFYFDNHGLSYLLNLVENYCYSYLNTKCETWFMNEIESIETNVKRILWLNYSDFIFNEKNERYELKDGAIKFSPLSKEVLRYDFIDYVNGISKNIPEKYKSSYIQKYNYAKSIDKFNEEFRRSLTTILRKYVYYTEKDLEVINWTYGKSIKPSIIVYYSLVDDEDIYEFISIPSFGFYQNIAFEFKNVPKGILYEYSDETIKDIESSMGMIRDDRLYELLNNNIQSIKKRKNLEIVSEEYFPGCYSIYCLDGETRYKYDVNNRLLDISDKHYLIGHPKIEDYTYKLQLGYINKIAYFKDPNYVISQESPGKYVDCYLLANDEYIALYALDYSKSTYVFKVKSGCIDTAIFLIWSYFSSRIYNKREGKTIEIEHLFSSFGIEGYANWYSPISKNEEGLYQFILPVCFYRNI